MKAIAILLIFFTSCASIKPKAQYYKELNPDAAEVYDPPKDRVIPRVVPVAALMVIGFIFLISSNPKR